MTTRPLGTPRPDIAADIKRRMVAETPGLRESDLTITAHETVTETVHLLKRSMLGRRLDDARPEPTDKTPIEFPSAQRLWPLTPGVTADGETAAGDNGSGTVSSKSAEILAKPKRGPGEGAEASPSASRLGLGIPEAERLVPRFQPTEEIDDGADTEARYEIDGT